MGVVLALHSFVATCEDHAGVNKPAAQAALKLNPVTLLPGNSGYCVAIRGGIPLSISNYAENELLDAVFNNGSFAVASTFVKLHTGDPGEACTANPAAHTTRVAASWTTASGGSVSNDSAVTFSSLTAAETISHISIWDASTAGNALWYGPLVTPRSVAVNDTLSFAIGDIVVTLD